MPMRSTLFLDVNTTGPLAQLIQQTPRSGDSLTRASTSTGRRPLVDPRTLTPERYAFELRDYERANIPDEDITRLKAHQAVLWLEAEQAHRAAELAAVGPIDPGADAILRVRVSPEKPLKGLERIVRRHLPGRNPDAPCPNARIVKLDQGNGWKKIIKAPCRRRTCPVCGPHWAALKLEGIRNRIDEALTAGARFEVVAVPLAKLSTWKKAIQRARERGIAVNGVNFPVDDTLVVLLARREGGDICKSLPAEPLLDAASYTEIALQAAQEAGRRAGSVCGIGTWKGNIDPYLGIEPEPSHKVECEFRSIPPEHEVIQMATDSGLIVRRCPGGFEYRERFPGAEALFTSQLDVVDRNRDRPPHWNDPDPF